jgi:ribosome maturation factor RimP
MAVAAERVEELLAPVVEAMGCELWAVEYVAQGPRSRLRLYIDTPSGVTLEDCERVSRQVSSVLDVEDPIPGEYSLEVSSPGLDRPLTRTEHYRRYVGSAVQVRLRTPIEGRRKLTATIEAVTDDGVHLRDGTSGELMVLSLTQIDKANLVPEV